MFFERLMMGLNCNYHGADSQVYGIKRVIRLRNRQPRSASFPTTTTCAFSLTHGPFSTAFFDIHIGWTAFVSSLRI